MTSSEGSRLPRRTRSALDSLHTDTKVPDAGDVWDASLGAIVVSLPEGEIKVLITDWPEWHRTYPSIFLEMSSVLRDVSSAICLSSSSSEVRFRMMRSPRKRLGSRLHLVA